ncbi:DinB family protein [Pedobacter sp. MC2016-15]|uniref:DinB family protein n=1 Tax=Pedobacter sp. MC2016-15 TaxID=2994473 RepID=UPI00224519C9|nr:DinB family protein [Pedobacter sp. MC2016-15]MCX2480845.1 DinB family protein [Pedobacter sp. MC2016-15]
MRNTTIKVLLSILCLVTFDANAQQKTTNQQKKDTMTLPATTNQNSLSAQEREDAIKFLEETKSELFRAIRNLKNNQITFKGDTEKWSIEECVKHIAAAETTLWAIVEESLKQPANPEKREQIKFNDRELINAVKDRTHKSNTFSALEPANSPYKTWNEAMESFEENREKLILFVKNTKDDLRNHVSVLPIGTYDAYQLILLISAHTNRHTQQIQQVKEDINFPKD